MIIQENFQGYHHSGGYSRNGTRFEGYGATLENVESFDAPSRSLWFLVGAVTAFLGPTLLNIATAGGSRAARRLNR